jgi:Asp-tRNA(Asn)/Glu-tRNA(Gln) amidotransferase A subunit family amidase
VITRDRQLGAAVHQDNLDAIANAAKLLPLAGPRGIRAELPEPTSPALHGQLRRAQSFVGVCSHDPRSGTRARPRTRSGRPRTRSCYGYYQQAPSISALDYEAARQSVQRLGFAMSTFMQDIDVLLMPMAARARRGRWTTSR